MFAIFIQNFNFSSNCLHLEYSRPIKFHWWQENTELMYKKSGWIILKNIIMKNQESYLLTVYISTRTNLKIFRLMEYWCNLIHKNEL